MNSYPEYQAFFEEVALKLELLGQEPGKINLFFVESPEQADTLLVAIKSKLTLPCLLVEFYDEDPSSGTGKFSDLSGAFVVLAQSEKTEKGHNHTRAAIYENAKPAADQVLAYMQRKADSYNLKIDGYPATMSPNNKGMWVGPLHNNLYGWRYEFTWRISASVCFKPAHWKP